MPGPAASSAQPQDESLPAVSPLLAMAAPERMAYLQGTIMREVREMIGHAVHPDEPLMASGKLNDRNK